MIEIYQILLSKYNDTALNDFQGLTPNEIDDLIYKPFCKSSIIQLNQNLSDIVLDKIPYFRLTEELFKIIEKHGKLKLTATTNSLPVKVMEELYEKKFITNPYFEQGLWKIKRERSSDLFTTLNITTRFCEYIKKYRGELIFTKAGNKWLNKKDRNMLLKVLLKTFIEKFNWSYNDGYPNLPVGQLGWAYTIFLLLKFGKDKRPVSFYSEQYFKAFPTFFENYPSEAYWTPHVGCHMCYSIRVVERFLEWFGLVEMTDFDFPFNKKEGNMQSTKLLTEMFLLRN